MLCRQPEKFSAKAAERDGFKGKQFKTQPAKTGRTPDTYFEKKHPWVSEVGTDSGQHPQSLIKCFIKRSQHH